MPTTNHSPSLYVRLKKATGAWRYHRIKEGRGLKTGEFAGPFYARPFINGKQVWKVLYSTAFHEAKKEIAQLALALRADAKGLTVAEADLLTTNRITIKAAIETYMEQVAVKAEGTIVQYRLALNEFQQAVTVRFMDEITVDVLRNHLKYMQSKGRAAKTIDTRINIVSFLLKKNGVAARLSKDEKPIVEEEAAVPFTEHELKTMFAKMTQTETVNGKEYAGVGFGNDMRYKFFLASDCRNREVKFAAWSDIDFDKKTYEVRKKTDVGFFPKSHESRTIPLPDVIISMLAERRKNAPHDRWIFTNEKGTPEGHFLSKLKLIALRIGLNCGQCKTKLTKGQYDKKHLIEVSCKDHPVCEHIYLHRFRKSCATNWEQHQVPARTIQHYLGHKSLETTMKYLGIKDSQELRGNINKAFAH